MTKFRSYFNLCSIPDPEEFMGIAPDRDEDLIIVTLSRNVVVLIKVSTQKNTQSWSFLEKLSSKVVYDCQSQKYVGVFGQRAIRCWDDSVVDINKVKKVKFERPIVDLVTNGSITLVLYNDGTCEELANALENRGKAANGSSHQKDGFSNFAYSDAKVLTLYNEQIALTYFKHNKETKALHLVKILLENGACVECEIRRDSVELAGYAVIDGDDTQMLLTIWRDQSVYLLSLDENADVSPGNFVATFTELDLTSPISILGVSKHLVAIYGAKNGQEGSSLLLYNTKFKLIKARQYFKTFLNLSRLWSVDQRIMISLGQNLSVLTYSTSKQMLAGLVGTQARNDFENTIHWGDMSSSNLLTEEFEFVKTDTIARISENNLNTKTTGDKGTTNKFPEADGKTIPYESVHNFDEMLSNLSKFQLHVEKIQVNQPLEGCQLVLKSKFIDTVRLTPDVQTIVDRMEKCGASEHEITERLLTILMKADLLSDIESCLRRYSNISEKMLAKTLKYLLNKLHARIHKDSSMENNNAKDQCSKTNLFNTLNVLLACSFNAKTIATHIRREVDYPGVILLLVHLHKLLTNVEEPSVMDPSLATATSFVQFEFQLLRWFGVLVSAHFQKLALCTDIELMELLFKWHELLMSYKSETHQLEQVCALLYNIVRDKQVVSNNEPLEWYSIETVKLF